MKKIILNQLSVIILLLPQVGVNIDLLPVQGNLAGSWTSNFLDY